MQSMGDVAGFSAALRVLAIDLSKIASDLRLMVMGPRTGIDEITLPAGAARIVHHARQDQSVDSGDGEPGLLPGDGTRHDGGHRVRARAARAERHDAGDRVQRSARRCGFSPTRRMCSPSSCVKGIQANREMCAYWVERSAALATALAPQIGYARAAEISKQSVKEGILIRDLVKRDGILPAGRGRRGARPSRR